MSICDVATAGGLVVSRCTLVVIALETGSGLNNPRLLTFESVVPRVGRRSRGPLCRLGSNLCGNRVAAQVSPRKWLMILAQFLLTMSTTFMSCWQENARAFSSLLTPRILLMFVLTSCDCI